MRGEPRLNRSVDHAGYFAMDTTSTQYGKVGVIAAVPLRAGETLAGFKSTTRFSKIAAGPTWAPTDIGLVGVFLVPIGELTNADAWREIFIQSSGTAAIRPPRTLIKECFQEVYNTHFADTDTYMSSADDYSQQLPELVTTMEVAGDEEELSLIHI